MRRHFRPNVRVAVRQGESIARLKRSFFKGANTVWTHQLLRYLFAGLLVLACDVAIFYLLITFYPNAFVANLLSRMACIPISFVLQRKTFSAQDGQAKQQLGRFIALWVFATSFGALVLQPLLLTQGPQWTALGKIILEGFLAIMNFFVMRFWVYADSKRGPKLGD